ncbi:MAG: hypothetical protein VX498_10465, partial [Myxococcota bacterium]|nr:hypothetical protein [Myxococcota bacterium]
MAQKAGMVPLEGATLPPMLRSTYPLLLIGALALGSCGTTPPPADPADGVDPSIAAAQGEARAGRIRTGPAGESALFGGIAAEGRPGDFKLYNDRVQFIIQDAYRSHGYIDTGGNIIDADLVRAGNELGRDPFDDFFLSNGLGWLFHAEEVAVVADGSDNSVARVRAQGHFVLWDFIHGAIESETPIIAEAPVDITLDYSLAPDSSTLEFEAHFSNPGFDTARFNPAFGFLGSDEDLWHWASGLGLNPPPFEEAAAVGVVGRWGEAAFTIWKTEGELRPLGLAEL